MKIDDVRINGISNPVGFAVDVPKISWKVRECVSQKQVSARIELSDTAGFEKILYQLEGSGLDSTGQALEFHAQPYTRYYCRVTVEGDSGETGVSEPAFFERGKGSEKWTASFISTDREDTFHPEFVKNFTIADPDRIRKARLYISGLGLYEAYINGKKAGDDYLAPFCNDYNEKIQYQTYEVTDLKAGDNRISVIVGNGWYKGRLGYEGASAVYGDRFSVIAELHIWYKDGREDIIGTDETWQYRGSDIEMSDIYDGEIYNHLLWKDRENPYRPAVILDMDAGRLVERYSLPVIVKEEMPVKEIIETPAGETVLDMGQNFTGYVEFHGDFPEGTRIVLDFGEILQQGNFYNDNYRTAKTQFIYVSDGRKETVRPHFTYYGFRYVRVSGWPGKPEKEMFTGKAVYSDLKTVISFRSSSRMLNQLASNCLWGQKSNFLDMPTDCPQRDERLGWTGDAQVFAPTACYQMDTRAFYRKFLGDVYIEQCRNDGAVPNYIPNIGGLPGGSSVWGDVATFVPMVLYRHYGDREELAGYYPMMKSWVDYIIRQEKENGGNNLWNFGFHFGDWLAQDGISPQSMKGGTDDYLIASVYYYASVGKVAEAADILGYSDESVYYADKAEKIRAAILEEYFSPKGRLAVDTQTAYLICLRFGVYRDKEKVRAGLKERLRKDCYRIKGGFVGAPMMCQVLAENGMEDIASKILFYEGFPGWMRCVRLGATTIWERWNSVLDDGTISGTGMNSLNHYSFGSVMEYVYRYMAGIQESEPGFRSVYFAPQLCSRLKFLECSYDSVSGRYGSSWQIHEDGTVTVKFTIPFGCTARAKLPSSPEEEKMLGPGEHEFTYRPERDYRKAYTMSSRLEEMQHDPRAMEILERTMPIAAGMIKSQDAENLNTSLEELKSMFFMGFNPDMVNRAADELLALDSI